MKKIVYLLALPIIMFSCSKEDADANSSLQTGPAYSLATPAGCTTVDLDHQNGCSGECLNCGPMVTVYPSSIAPLDDLAANGNSGDISSYFSGSEWQELFPDFMDEFWSDVFDAILNEECNRIDKHEQDNATVYVFYDFSGNVMFAKPFVINE